jgi:hypothetical protein
VPFLLPLLRSGPSPAPSDGQRPTPLVAERRPRTEEPSECHLSLDSVVPVLGPCEGETGGVVPLPHVSHARLANDGAPRIRLSASSTSTLGPLPVVVAISPDSHGRRTTAGSERLYSCQWRTRETLPRCTDASRIRDSCAAHRSGSNYDCGSLSQTTRWGARKTAFVGAACLPNARLATAFASLRPLNLNELARRSNVLEHGAMGMVGHTAIAYVTRGQN